LLRKVVEKIIANPDERKVSCYLKRLPMVDLLAGLADRGDTLLGEQGSANVNLVHPVNMLIITEMFV